MTRAVLDPNVLVAAAIRPGGTPSRCLVAYGEGLYELVVSPLLLAELRSVLRRKKFRPFLTLEQGERLVDALERDARLADDPPESPALSRDPSDDYLIALARSVGAHVLVSGDQDLLELDLADLRVVSPRAFLDALPGA
ncbi:MAG: putative toxin-antitoxin system toxin component, PIN family [Actinobacteria bacterium]|nr:putative toxin-antitoxin system toxin component, PIN family [Actinomycetota bacterium]